MKKLSLIILALLIPTIALGDVMIFFKSTPTAIYRKLQGPTWGVKVDDGDADVVSQPIMVAQPEGSDKAFWAVLVPDDAPYRAKPGFLGKGLTEVQKNFPGAYRKMCNWTWQSKTDPKDIHTVSMSDNTYQVGTAYRKVAADLAPMTYFGYNPFTGMAE